MTIFLRTRARSPSCFAVLALAFAAALVSGGAACERPPSDLPLGHWAYPMLERLAARGLIDLDLTTLPVARSDAERAVVACVGPDREDMPTSLTEREVWALELLADELCDCAVDAPAVHLESGDASLALGLVLGNEFTYDGDGEPEASVDVAYELWGGIGRRVGFYCDTEIILEGQDGPRVESLSSRARTWRGIAVHADRAYVKYERRHLEVSVGRRGAAWGRSPGGRLMLSGTAPTFDCLDARFKVGPLTLEAIHAFLERTELEGLSEADTLAFPDGRAFLAAHRLVLTGDWGSVGIGESVVYSADLPDPTYVNPLMPYYLSQHNERENDNVLWSLDALARPFSGLDVWGEFVVDDLQYERSADAPDKYGVTVGAQYFGASPAGDYDVLCEYTNLRKWTYTHRIAGHRYTHDGRPIGFELGPDADRLSVELSYHPRPRWTVASAYSFTRKGEGNIATPFVKGEDDEPTFPSGDVTRTHRTDVSLVYLEPGRFQLALGGAFEWWRDDGGDDDSYEIWARVSFRI